MNPYTGQTTPVDTTALLAGDKFLWEAERKRAATEVGLDDPDDLLLLTGKVEHVQKASGAIKAQDKAKRRAANKRARKSRKANR